MLGMLICLSGCADEKEDTLKTVEGLQEKVTVLEGQLKAQEEIHQQAMEALRNSHTGEIQIKQNRITELEAQNKELQAKLSIPEQIQEDYGFVKKQLEDVKNDLPNSYEKAYQTELLVSGVLVVFLAIVLIIMSFLYYNLRRKNIGWIVENIQDKHNY